MPIVPNLLERLLLFRLHRAPAPILDLFGAASFRAVALALDMGLFEALDDGPVGLDALADRLDADPAGLRALLAFLAAEGYVEETARGYHNARLTTEWLTDAAGTNMAPWLRFWHELVFPFWAANLETAVREGAPRRTIYEWFDEDPDRWTIAQAGFRAAASLLVDGVVDRLEVPPGATSLLDVGGGHGLYAIELCRKHPDLRATVFDTPPALDAARDEIERAGLGERVGVVGGDYWTDDLGEGHDVALVFNVIHAHDAEENRRLFRRVNEALAPDGRIAILDQLEGSARMPVGRAGLGFIGLTYLSTLGAQTHPYEDVVEWLLAAGFERVDRSAIRQAGPGNTLVQARKPGV